MNKTDCWSRWNWLFLSIDYIIQWSISHRKFVSLVNDKIKFLILKKCSKLICFSLSVNVRSVYSSMTELTESEVEKVAEIKSKNETKEYPTSFKVQSYFNNIVHILNGGVACFMTIQLIREIRNGWPNTNDLFPLHAFLTTVGYQLFMAEAILVFYTPNSWSYFLSLKTKKHLHWILHLLGAIFIIAGNVLISVIRTTPHFVTVHSITGLLKRIQKNWFLEMIFISFKV